jgi:hypothetical protein
MKVRWVALVMMSAMGAGVPFWMGATPAAMALLAASSCEWVRAGR